MKKNILLAFFSTSIILILLEIVLRIFNPGQAPQIQKPKEDWALIPERVWTEYHPMLGWYHQKNKMAVHKLPEWEVNVHTNAAGFRGTREYSKEKPKDVTRIAAVGDSFFFGFGVADFETFEARMENKYSNLEVLNMGVAGYGLDQLLMLYRTIAKDYHPDYVLIGVFPEDFWRSTRAFADSGHAKPYFFLNSQNELILHNTPVPPQFSLQINQFPEVVEHSPLEKFMNQSILYRFARKKMIRLGKNLRLIDPDSSEEWILGRRILEQLIKEIRDQGSHPVLVIVPSELWAQRQKPESLLRSIRLLAQRVNVDVVDLVPIFQQAVTKGNDGDYYIKNDRHWTAKGHEAVVQVIEKYLMSQNVPLEQS